MSGNIFASSTVPGIKDRDRDKQVVALWGQSYYLSRNDFTTTYWIKLMIGSTLLMVVVPIFFARLFFSAILQPQPNPSAFLSRLFPPALRPTEIDDSSTFQLVEIPVSAVLTEALASSNTTRSRGLLAHALLEFQNPELTSFAGLGYGVHLKEMNRGAQLEAFPDGKLPWCGVKGRYDEWGRVRGLRYAYKWIRTTGDTSLMRAPPDEDLDAGEFDFDSLLMGWPALLLERARVDDPLNPVPPGSRRNVFGEAVGSVVEQVRATGQCEDGHHIHRHAKISSTIKDRADIREDSQQRLLFDENNDEDSTFSHSLTMKDATSMFILPPFLAIYAVARQDTKWLMSAVKELERYQGTYIESGNKQSEYWMVDPVEMTPTDGVSDIQDERKEILRDPWALAGVVRVLSVLERWRLDHNNSAEKDRNRFENWKKTATNNLKERVNTILLELHDENSDMTELVPFCVNVISGSCTSSVRSQGLTTLLVATIYRLAQLEMLDDISLLDWADGLYNVVAGHLDADGKLSQISEKEQTSNLNPGEDQSMIIMMWAARRDCAKAGFCRIHKPPTRLHRLRAWISGFISKRMTKGAR